MNARMAPPLRIVPVPPLSPPSFPFDAAEEEGARGVTADFRAYEGESCVALPPPGPQLCSDQSSVYHSSQASADGSVVMGAPCAGVQGVLRALALAPRARPPPWPRRSHKQARAPRLATYAGACTHALTRVLEEGEVHVYWLSPSQASENDATRDAALEGMLSDAEQMDVRAGRTDDARRERLHSRAILRSVLSRYFPGVHPGAFAFGAGPHGKPYLEHNEAIRDAIGDRGALHFNITHCPTLVGICVAGVDVGIDAEHLAREPKHDVLRIAERRFGADEARALAHIPAGRARNDRFFELWTLKEAFLKATGVGINYRWPDAPLGLRHCTFSFDGSEAGRGTFALPQAPHRPGAWRFATFEVCPGTIATICVADPEEGQGKGAARGEGWGGARIQFFEVVLSDDSGDACEEPVAFHQAEAPLKPRLVI